MSKNKRITNMKKVLLGFMLVMVTGLLAPAAFAIEADTGPAGMARYFDQDTSMFVAARIDDAYIGELSSFANRILAKIPASAGLPAEVDLRALLADQLASSPVSLDDLRSFVGDYIALGISDYGALATNDLEDAGLIVALSLTDPAKLISTLEANAPDLPTPTTEGDFKVYTSDNFTYVAIGSDVLYFYQGDDDVPTIMERGTLMTKDGYTNSLAAMPLDSYNIITYFDYKALFSSMAAMGDQMADTMTPEMLSLLPQNMAIGFTILDDAVLTMDITTDQRIDGMMTTPLTPEFAANIPADTDLLIWGSDLKAYAEYILGVLPDSIAASGASESREEIQQQIEDGLKQFEDATKINLRRDVLSWMTSDYALYTSIDIPGVIRMMAAAGSSSSDRTATINPLPFQFGLVANTSDPTTTGQTIEKLVTLMKSALADNTSEDITLTDLNGDPLNGVELQVNIPLNSTEKASLNLVIGSNANIFFIGTRGAFDAATRGSNLTNDETYALAQKYAMPNQTLLLYADDEGLTAMMGVVVLAGMQTMNTSDADTTQRTTMVLDTLNAVFAHAIVSYSYDENGFMVSRATIAIK